MNYYDVDNYDGTNSYVNIIAKKLYTNNSMIMIGMNWQELHKFCKNNYPLINPNQMIYSLKVSGKLFKVITNSCMKKSIIWRKDLVIKRTRELDKIDYYYDDESI